MPFPFAQVGGTKARVSMSIEYFIVDTVSSSEFPYQNGKPRRPLYFSVCTALLQIQFFHCKPNSSNGDCWYLWHTFATNPQILTKKLTGLAVQCTRKFAGCLCMYIVDSLESWIYFGSTNHGLTCCGMRYALPPCQVAFRVTPACIAVFRRTGEANQHA